MNYSELNENKTALPEETPNHVGGETHKYEGGKKKKTMKKKKAKKAKKAKKGKTMKKKSKKANLLKKVMKLFK